MDTTPEKRRGRPPKERPPIQPVMTIRGVKAFSDWLDGFAEHCGEDKVEVIVEALRRMAAQKHYAPPPDRKGGV